MGLILLDFGGVLDLKTLNFQGIRSPAFTFFRRSEANIIDNIPKICVYRVLYRPQNGINVRFCLEKK